MAIDMNKIDEPISAEMPENEQDIGHSPRTLSDDDIKNIMSNNDSVLDFGCRWGEYIPLLKEWGNGSVDAIDIDPNCMTVLKEKTKQFAQIRYICCDIVQDESSLRGYDFILSSGVFPSIPHEQKLKVFNVLINHLNEDGYLLFNENKKNTLVFNLLLNLIMFPLTPFHAIGYLWSEYRRERNKDNRFKYYFGPLISGLMYVPYRVLLIYKHIKNVISEFLFSKSYYDFPHPDLYVKALSSEYDYFVIPKNLPMFNVHKNIVQKTLGNIMNYKHFILVHKKKRVINE